MGCFSQSVFRRIHLSRLSVLEYRGLRAEAGSALVELGLMLGFLGVPLLLGVGHFGVLLLDSIEITNAAHAGAEYAMRSSTFAEENPGIIAAAQNESSRIASNLTVTPTIFYACSNAIGGTQYSTQTLANAACTGGSSHSLEFIQVIASATVTPPVKAPGFANSVTLSSTSVMEVEE
jgi:hypothetical protein